MSARNERAPEYFAEDPFRGLPDESRQFTPTPECDAIVPEQGLELLRTALRDRVISLRGGKRKPPPDYLMPPPQENDTLQTYADQAVHNLWAAHTRYHSHHPDGDSPLAHVELTDMSNVLVRHTSQLAEMDIPQSGVSSMYYKPADYSIIFEVGRQRGLSTAETKYFIRLNLLDPLSEIENYPFVLENLQERYGSHPDITEEFLKSTTYGRPANPVSAVQKYLANLEEMRDTFGDHYFLRDNHLRYLCEKNLRDPQRVIEQFIRKHETHAGLGLYARPENYDPQATLDFLRNALHSDPNLFRFGTPPDALIRKLRSLIPEDYQDMDIASSFKAGCYRLAMLIHSTDHMPQIGDDGLAPLVDTYCTQVIESSVFGVRARLVGAVGLYHDPAYFRDLFTVGYSRGLTDDQINLCIAHNRADPFELVEEYADTVREMFCRFGDDPRLTLAATRFCCRPRLDKAESRMQKHMDSIQRQPIKPPKSIKPKAPSRTHGPIASPPPPPSPSLPSPALLSKAPPSVQKPATVKRYNMTKPGPPKSTKANEWTDEVGSDSQVDFHTKILRSSHPPAEFIARQRPKQTAEETAPSANDDQAWRLRASCKDQPETLVYFYAKDRKLQKIGEKICATCPVVNHCLLHALKEEQIGIWGGTTSINRRKLARKLALVVFERRETDPEVQDAINTLPAASQTTLERVARERPTTMNPAETFILNQAAEQLAVAGFFDSIILDGAFRPANQ